MRTRILVLVSALFLAFPLLAADPNAALPAEPIGVLHLDGQQIEIFSWSWGVTQETVRTTEGASRGRVQMQDFQFTKTVDKSSPKLFQACATGSHFRDATFVARKAGGKQQEYLVVKFSDLLVTSYQTGGSSGAAVPTESITINFAEVDFHVPGR